MIIMDQSDRNVPQIWGERDIRRAIEDRFEHLSPRLYLGEVPDGWLGIVETLLYDVDKRLPDVCCDGDSFSLHFKEKFGDLDVHYFVDSHADHMAERFLVWLRKRIETAQGEAQKSCARCGASGRADDVDFAKSGWILPLCRRHRITREGGH